MNPFRRASVRRWVARALVCAMLSPVVFSPTAVVAAQSKPLPPTVVVLPFGPSTQMRGSVAPTLGASLTRALSSSLRGTGKFDVIQFTTAHPSIARAVEEQRLRTAQVTPPFEDPEVAVQIAREMGTEYAIAGVIEDYTYDAGSQKATLAVSVQWLEAKSGQALKTVAISVEAQGSAASTQDEVDAKAVAEAVNRVLSELAIGEVSVVQPTQVPAKKPSVKRGNSLGWIVLGIGLIAAFASGARGGGEGLDFPPPAPLAQ